MSAREGYTPGSYRKPVRNLETGSRVVGGRGERKRKAANLLLYPCPKESCGARRYERCSQMKGLGAGRYLSYLDTIHSERQALFSDSLDNLPE